MVLHIGHAMPSGKHPIANSFLLQDPKHTANAYPDRKKKTQTHSGTLLVMDSPPYSLNLASIETVWVHIDRGTNQPPFTTLKLLLLSNINTKSF